MKTLQKFMIPEERRPFARGDIELMVDEIEGRLIAEVLLKNIHSQDYPSDAKISLEAYTGNDVEIIKLGSVEEYREEIRKITLRFSPRLRSKVKFRLKIVDSNSHKLLGYAENLRNDRLGNELPLECDYDSKVKNLYRLDLSDSSLPSLHLNPEIAPFISSLEPIIAEMVFREILNHLVLPGNGVNRDENEWFLFADKLVKYNDAKDDSDWVNHVLCEFSERTKLIKAITKTFEVDDET